VPFLTHYVGEPTYTIGGRNYDKLESLWQPTVKIALFWYRSRGCDERTDR